MSRASSGAGRWGRAAAVLAGMIAGQGAAWGQATEDCGPAAPLLTLGVPFSGDNTGALTHAFVTASACGGFTGSGGITDVFARFIAPSDGVYRFSTCGSSFDTVLSVHSACPAGDSNLVGCNDSDGACDTQSIVDVRLTAGAEYHVRIASQGELFEPVSGPFTLTVTQSAAPANDECGSAIPVTPGSATPGTNANATGGNVGACAPDGRDVWYSLAVVTTGVYTIDTEGSAHQDTVLTVYNGCGGGVVACDNNSGASPNQASVATLLNAGTTYLIRLSGWRDFGGSVAQGEFTLNVSNPQPPLSNDHCSGATPVAAGSSTPGTSVGSTPGPISGCSVSDTKDVWYAFTPPARAEHAIWLSDTGGFETALSVYDGCQGTEIACANLFSDNRVTLILEPSRTYHLRVAGALNTVGTFTLNVDAGTAIPPNDLCQDAAVVGVGQTAATSRASTGVDETPECAHSDTRDVWFEFTAPGAGYYTFDTRGSTDLDTTLSLFDTCGGSPTVCNNDIASDEDLVSSVDAALGAGQRVLVRVSGFFDQTGPFLLNVSGPAPVPPAPSNDTCATPVEITGDGFTATVDARRASPDVDTSCNFETPALQETPYGVWYRFIAPDDGLLTFAETGPVRANIAVLRGGCEAFPDECGLEVTFEAFEGETLLFLVGPEDAQYPGSPYSLSFSFRPRLGCCTVGGACSVGTKSACAGAWSPTPCGVARSYSSPTNVPLALPNPPSNTQLQYVTSAMTVGDSFVVSNAEVTLSIQHEFATDVYAELISPGGAVVKLVENDGSGAGFNGSYTLSDFGLLAMDEIPVIVDPVQQRTYRAAQPIGDALSGQNAAGQWTLRAADDRRNSQAGQITHWSLTLYDDSGCASPPCRADFDNQNGVQVADIFAFLRAWFAQNPSADFDGQNGIQVADIFAFLRAWFAGCP